MSCLKEQSMGVLMLLFRFFYITIYMNKDNLNTAKVKSNFHIKKAIAKTDTFSLIKLVFPSAIVDSFYLKIKFESDILIDILIKFIWSFKFFDPS